MSIPETPIPKEEYKRLGDEIYVTDSLLEKYHTAEGAARFRGWAIQATMLFVERESVYFPADYEKWIAAGLPERSSAD
jgi:hypothetical protein